MYIFFVMAMRCTCRGTNIIESFKQMTQPPSATDFSVFENLANKAKVSVRKSEKPKRKKSKGSRRTRSVKGPVDTIVEENIDASFGGETDTTGLMAGLDDETDDFNDAGGEGFAAPNPPAYENNIRMEREDEKAELLAELEAMRRSGRVLSKSYTMEDSLETVEWEYRKQKSQMESESALDFMKSGLGIFCAGVELLNQKIGPILSIDGWSGSIQRDMSKFDQPLNRIYRKIWRRGAGLNPFVHLAFLLVASLGTYHMTSRLRGTPQTTAAPPVRHTPPPMPTPEKPPSRPTMKRPTMSMPTRRTPKFDATTATAGDADTMDIAAIMT